MQQGSSVSLNDSTPQSDCSFCQQDRIAPYVLKETPAFRLVADHAPLVEGHLLIIPKDHYACYGATPAPLDAELADLKEEVQKFFSQFYASCVFWEHGVFRQTVFHAHLHCFPFGKMSYDLATNLHQQIIHSQNDIRSWYASQGHYFYLEDARHALLFAPNMDHYLHVIREVLWPGASAHNGHRQWRSQQQRYEEGEPLIQATITRWQQFQQQEVHHAN
jgi:diadenosine tetraphosphate (Ap4A) HIT family hydrolase